MKTCWLTPVQGFLSELIHTDTSHIVGNHPRKFDAGSVREAELICFYD